MEGGERTLLSCWGGETWVSRVQFKRVKETHPFPCDASQPLPSTDFLVIQQLHLHRGWITLRTRKKQYFKSAWLVRGNLKKGDIPADSSLCHQDLMTLSSSVSVTSACKVVSCCWASCRFLSNQKFVQCSCRNSHKSIPSPHTKPGFPRSNYREGLALIETNPKASFMVFLK